jgi:hypothetical protein
VASFNISKYLHFKKGDQIEYISNRRAFHPNTILRSVNMTYPSEFRTQTKTIGSTAIKHPIYTFRVNLGRQATERIGPNTNQSTAHVLHPDSYNQSPDYGRTLVDAHFTGNVSWLPGFLQGENIDINNNGTITAYGQKAVYLNQNYTSGDFPLLTLTNSAPYTSA